MARGKLDGDGEFMELKPDFIRGFDWERRDKSTKRKLVVRDHFCKWASGERDPRLYITPHDWRPLRDGNPVPREMVEAFSEYISDHLKIGKFPLSAIAALSQRKGPMDGWSRLVDLLTDRFSITGKTFCRNEGDIRFAGATVLQWVGSQTDPTLAGADAIALGERVMQRSLGDYIAMLRMLYEKNRNSIIFATQGAGSSSVRTGVAISAPITEDFYRKFRGGDAEDSDMVAGDILPTSGHVLLDAAAIGPGLDRRRAKIGLSISLAQAVVVQLAYLLPRLQDGMTDPCVIAASGTDANRKWLRVFKYYNTGSRTRLSGNAVMEYAPPDAGMTGLERFQYLAQYRSMKLTILTCQDYIHSVLDRDD